MIKLAGPYKVSEVYPRAVRVKLPEDIRIFPVFHTSLLYKKTDSTGLVGQDTINEAESRNTRGRILEREDGTDEVVETWEFENLLDCKATQEGPYYLIKWRHHKPTWQPAADLKGQDTAILKFHKQHPNKPKPPTWIKQPILEPPAKRPRGRPRKNAELLQAIDTKRKVSFALCQHTALFR